MRHRHLIGHAVTTPSTLDSSGRPRALPDDLLREASRRLAVIALLGATLWVAGTVLGHLAGYPSLGAAAFHLDFSDAVAAASALISLALFFYARRCPRGPHFSLDLGLVYMVFTGIAIGLTFHWNPVPSNFPIYPMISWTGVVVLISAAFVPSTPAKTLVASLVAVSMTPLTMLLAKARGAWDYGPNINVVIMHYPDYLLAGVAVVISHVITKLGHQVAKARELGSYELGELLGRGGMGEVYKATHRMLARPAAIKLIRTEMLGAVDDEAAKLAVTRFRREAEAAANLRSQHTVELYDFGVTEDGTLYLVIEFLDGMDLESLVRETGPLPAGRGIHILRQVCDSLEEAHSRGLVHRDIKPANIHLGLVGLHHDFVKVLDFGLVKEVSSLTPESSMATIPGQMALGTPAYMAPEMALGELVDGRADIYALGCVAYYLLTGQLVFEAEKAFQMIAKLLQTPPVPPSQRTDQPLSPELEDLILKCLAKDARHRPQSARELADALTRVPADAWGEEEARHWWMTRRSVEQLSSTSAAGLSVGIDSPAVATIARI